MYKLSIVGSSAVSGEEKKISLRKKVEAIIETAQKEGYDKIRIRSGPSITDQMEGQFVLEKNQKSPEHPLLLAIVEVKGHGKDSIFERDRRFAANAKKMVVVP